MMIVMLTDDLIKVFLGISNNLIQIIILIPVVIAILYWRFKGSLVFNIALAITVFAVLTSIVSSMTTYANDNVSNISMPLELIVSPISIGVLILLAMYLNKTVFKPLKNFVEVNEQLAKGNFNIEIKEIAKNNELGQLSSSLKSTLNFIKQSLSEIEQIAVKLSTSAQEMASSSEEVNASSEEISSISQQMSKGAQEQTAQIHDSSKAALTLRKNFDEKVLEINQSAQLIESIATQVNMLALNASIEAARAGEYGRGFAVVADNIRNLADDSKSSVGKVQNTIDSLNNSMSHSISDITNSIERVASVAEETASGSEEASAATEQQAATMEEITAYAHELADMSARLTEVVQRFQIS